MVITDFSNMKSGLPPDGFSSQCDDFVRQTTETQLCFVVNRFLLPKFNFHKSLTFIIQEH